MKSAILCLAVMAILGLYPLSAAASNAIIEVNFSSATLRVVDAKRTSTIMETKVVLPAGDYYPVPVRGTLRKAVMGPTWTPTANMHRDYPGRYKRSYGPFEPGNAMGHCKLYIDFQSSHPLMRVVRIHGNAREQDLGKRLSRSCVRIPDALCPTLVELAQSYDTVHIEFIR